MPPWPIRRTIRQPPMASPTSIEVVGEVESIILETQKGFPGIYHRRENVGVPGQSSGSPPKSLTAADLAPSVPLTCRHLLGDDHLHEHPQVRQGAPLPVDLFQLRIVLPGGRGDR